MNPRNLILLAVLVALLYADHRQRVVSESLMVPPPWSLARPENGLVVSVPMYADELP